MLHGWENIPGGVAGQKGKATDSRGDAGGWGEKWALAAGQTLAGLCGRGWTIQTVQLEEGDRPFVVNGDRSYGQLLSGQERGVGWRVAVKLMNRANSTQDVSGGTSLWWPQPVETQILASKHMSLSNPSTPGPITSWGAPGTPQPFPRWLSPFPPGQYEPHPTSFPPQWLGWLLVPPLHRDEAAADFAATWPEMLVGRGKSWGSFWVCHLGLAALLLMHSEQLNHILLICQTYLHINKHDHSYKP